MSDKFLVDIKDFQSLKNVHLDLPKGITIITGKTNEGKSSVFRAIDAALFNLGDDSMIRGGQRYYGVSIDNGSHKMVFMRDGKGKNEKSAYQFDGGTVQKKVGRTQLQEVADYFNIRDVRMQNGSKMKINFWYQNDKPFLTDKTSGQLYEFLSLSSCDKYSRVLKTMKADERVIESNINSVTAEIDTLKIINNKKQDFIDKNDGFDDTYIKVVKLSQESNRLQELISILQDIAKISDKIKEGRNKLKEITDKYNKIPITDLTKRYNRILDFYREVVSDSKNVDDIEKLKKDIDMITIDKKEKTDRFDSSERMKKSISKSIESTTENSSKVYYLIERIREHNITEDEIRTVKNKIKSIENRIFKNEKDISTKVLTLERAQDHISTLIFDIDYIKDIEDSIHKARTDLDKINVDIENNEKSLERLKEEVGYCPFCGTVFNQ